MGIFMESTLTLLNMENARTLLLLVVAVGGFVWLKSQFKQEVDSKIGNLESSLKEYFNEKLIASNAEFYHLLKTNDFAHLNATIEALTFTLEKNGIFDSEDKKYVDGRLDRG